MQSIQDRLRIAGYSELIDSYLGTAPKQYCCYCSNEEDCDYKNRRTMNESTCIDYEERI